MMSREFVAQQENCVKMSLERATVSVDQAATTQFRPLRFA